MSREERDDGGPAFPRHETEYHRGAPGMTLRQWYAGQGLIGLMSGPGMRPSNVDEFEHMAKRLFQVADAMLAESRKVERSTS